MMVYMTLIIFEIVQLAKKKITRRDYQRGDVGCHELSRPQPHDVGD